jgi:tetratricopeptide (TPR) repeat protein
MGGLPDFLLRRAGLESEDCYREVRRWRPAADAGDAAAAYRVGQALSADRRYRRAVRYLRRAADAGTLAAAEDLAALMHMRRRWDQARAWSRRAGDLARGRGLPATEVAGYYLKARELDEAEGVLRPAAEAGDADAAVRLGGMLEEYRADDRLDEAARWYATAYERGDRSVWPSLGKVLEKLGRAAEAEGYYRREADRGDIAAAFLLGLGRIPQGRYEEEVKYLRMTVGGHGTRYNVPLIKALASIGRLAGVWLPLPDRSEAGEDEIREIAYALRSAGHVAEAQQWDEQNFYLYYEGGS